MKNNCIRRLLVICTGFLIAIGSASAQDASDDQADVWSVVESQWEAVAKNDKKWLDRMLTEDFEGWAKNSPAPRNQASTKMWNRFADEQGKTVAHELYPLSIIVHDDLAIAHYLYTNAFEDKDGEVEVNNGRYTDILVRTADGWKFIGWHGGDDE